jgi:hypothetical protein
MSNDNNGWISVHEELPPPNPYNPHNSITVIWCDADDDNPDYAQHIGKLWYLNPEVKLSMARFDGGNSSQYISDPNSGVKRDLYWRHPEKIPKPVKR